MTNNRLNVDILLKETLKKEDRIKIPEEREFYEKMLVNIMSGVANTEIEKGNTTGVTNKWSKPWVFLEPGKALEEGAVKLHSDKMSTK